LVQALGDGRLAIANPASVPAGKYGKAALETLGVWPSVEGRLAPAHDVRAALALVSGGEAPLGIVYQTDAAVDKNVYIVGAFPPAPPPAYRLSAGGDRSLHQFSCQVLHRVPSILRGRGRHWLAGVRAPSAPERAQPPQFKPLRM